METKKLMLIVAADLVEREALANKLASLGNYTVLQAGSQAESLAVLKGVTPDLAISEVRLPTMESAAGGLIHDINNDLAKVIGCMSKAKWNEETNRVTMTALLWKIVEKLKEMRRLF